MIWGLRAKLEEERKKSQWVRSDKIKRVMERNELEEFFIECMDEVRKDIQRRKLSQLCYTAAKKNSVNKGSASAKSFETYQEGNDNEAPPKLD